MYVLNGINKFVFAYFKTKSSLRRLSSSKSNAELVLLRVTDKLCVSCESSDIFSLKAI